MGASDFSYQPFDFWIIGMTHLLVIVKVRHRRSCASQRKALGLNGER